jgi:hypothetical protein
LGSESEKCVGSRVHLVGVSISFEKNFYRLPFTPPLSGSLYRSFRTVREDFKIAQGSAGVPSSLGMFQVFLRTFGLLYSGTLEDYSPRPSRLLEAILLDYKVLGGLLYGPPWAHYLCGYQDRLLGGPLGLPSLCHTAPDGVRHKVYGGEVLG